MGGHQRTFVQFCFPFLPVPKLAERVSAERRATLQITLMTTGALLPRSHQLPCQRDRVLHLQRKRQCIPVPRPRTHRACRIETARSTCAVCQSDCIYPKGPYCKILRLQFSKMVRAYYPVRGATLWPPFPPKPHSLPHRWLSIPPSRAPRGLLLYLLTIPCPHRYTQHPRGSTLSAFATSFSCPGSRCRSDARICATSGSNHASRS